MRAIGFVLAAASAMALTGCATKQAAPPEATAQVFPQDQLCRIGQLRSSGRYVAFITSECASGTKIVGLRSARSQEELRKLGAD